MKPENLKAPFKWDQRQIHFSDRVWYVPDRIIQKEEFHFPGWADPQFFGNSNPLAVEYCSGNGAWVAEKALANPLINWVAVEKKFYRVKKIWSKIKNYQLNNLIAICGEGSYVTKTFFKDQTFSNVYINFPDPWPKTRHAKHRIVQPYFLNELRRCLVDGGRFTFVTDDEGYSKWLIKMMNTQKGYRSLFEDPYYVTEISDYGSSYFEDLWREKGLTIRYHQFQKIEA